MPPDAGSAAVRLAASVELAVTGVRCCCPIPWFVTGWTALTDLGKVRDPVVAVPPPALKPVSAASQRMSETNDPRLLLPVSV